MSTGRFGCHARSNWSECGCQGAGSMFLTRLPSASSKPHFNRPACQSASLSWAYGPSKTSPLRSLRCARPRTRTPSRMPSPIVKARMPVSITTVLSDWPRISSTGTTPGSTSSGGPIHAGCGGSSGSSLSPGGGVSGKKSIAASSRTWPLAPRTTDARSPLATTSATTGGRVALRGMSVTCRDGPADEGEAGRQVRLYLSSFRMGDHPEYLTDLVGGNNQRAAVIANAMDDAPGDVRRSGVERELAALAELGFDTVELDLRGYNDDGNRLRRDLSGLALTW